MGENTALLAPPENLIEADESEPEPGPTLRQGETAEDEAETPVRPPVPVHSFEAFFESQQSNLLRAMYLICGNRHEAEELAQDAFVRAYERWHLVSRADNPAGYLYRIGLNLYRSKLRRAARAARKVVKPPPEADPFGAADDRDAIGRALAALTKGQREAVVMVEWLGMTDDEAGQALGISPVTVRVRIHRARGTLRPILKGDRA
jgi:RNA polymerase sigma factor (sigma-70 family)